MEDRKQTPLETAVAAETPSTTETAADHESVAWQLANQQFLEAAIESVQLGIESHIALQNNTAWDESRQDDALANLEIAKDRLPAPSSLERLFNRFQLETFEIELLLLCAGMELNPAIPLMCAEAHGDLQLNYPTFSLAVATLPELDWHYISSLGSLRRWRMIEITSGPTFMTSPLSIDGSILYFLMGLPHNDPRFAGIIEPLGTENRLAPSHVTIVEQLTTTWQEARQRHQYPLLQLCGWDKIDKREIAAATAKALGLGLYYANVQALPTGPNEVHSLLQLWDREAYLFDLGLLIECEQIEDLDTDRAAALHYWLENSVTLIILSSWERGLQANRPLITFDVEKPTRLEQGQLWETHLAEINPDFTFLANLLVFQFSMTYPAIHTTWLSAVGQLSDIEPEYVTATKLDEVLWESCRVQARQKLADLVQRIEPQASWDDLMLPDLQHQALKALVAQVKQRAVVYDQWGFSQQGTKGMGISALFAGPSGTGKTLAAEVLARELRLDLYHIDLSTVMSKYIGETEKHLRKVFDAAANGGAILLFDEADALFGKRTDVMDSHDRNANIGVSYLLQQMEAYPGLAILTTNMPEALDNAFLRRLQFIVRFPFPDAALRLKIWQCRFPSQMPQDGLDFEKLAQLRVTGGTIRNIVLKAAFLAAEDGNSVTMSYLLQATRSEYSKLEKSLSMEEIRGWAEGANLC